VVVATIRVCKSPPPAWGIAPETSIICSRKRPRRSPNGPRTLGRLVGPDHMADSSAHSRPKNHFGAEGLNTGRGLGAPAPAPGPPEPPSLVMHRASARGAPTPETSSCSSSARAGAKRTSRLLKHDSAERGRELRCCLYIGRGNDHLAA